MVSSEAAFRDRRPLDITAQDITARLHAGKKNAEI